VIEKVYGVASRIFRPTKPARDRAYLAYIRQMHCIGCGTLTMPREAMHIGPHGLGQKASDLDTLPGCRECHERLHRIGPVKFQAERGITFRDLIQLFQHLYRIEFPERHQEPPVNEKKEGAA
jgi:hypothetical protein